MNKKFIILIVLSACLMLIALVLMLLPKNNTSQQQPASTQPNSFSNSSSPISGSQNVTGNVPNKYPTPVVKQEMTQPDTNIEPVTDATDKSQIQNGYNKFSSSTPESFKWTDFVGPNRKSINLNDFSQAVGLKINPGLTNLLDTSKFDLFSCPASDGIKNFGIALNFKLLPDYKGDLYKDELSIMSRWEPTLFQDTKTIIFPNINFSPQQLTQKLIFTNGQYRYAEISLPDNKKSSINYEIIDDYVVIANSPDCLKKASDEILAPE